MTVPSSVLFHLSAYEIHTYNQEKLIKSSTQLRSQQNTVKQQETTQSTIDLILSKQEEESKNLKTYLVFESRNYL